MTFTGHTVFLPSRSPSIATRPIVTAFKRGPASTPNASTSASTSTQSVSQTTAGHQPKKLANLFKVHRKRLEKLPVPATGPAVTAASALEWELQELSRRLGRLQALGTIDAESSDSSDSDEEEECKMASVAMARFSAQAVASTSGRTSSSMPTTASTRTISRSNSSTSISCPETFTASPSYQQAGRLLVCQGRKCCGGADVLRTASALAESSPGVEVMPVKCAGRCNSGGCAVRVKVEGQPCAVYGGLDSSGVSAIMDVHFAPAVVPTLQSSRAVRGNAANEVAALRPSVSLQGEDSCCKECKQ